MSQRKNTLEPIHPERLKLLRAGIEYQYKKLMSERLKNLGYDPKFLTDLFMRDKNQVITQIASYGFGSVVNEKTNKAEEYRLLASD